jgi:hypothetical protein
MEGNEDFRGAGFTSPLPQSDESFRRKRSKVGCCISIPAVTVPRDRFCTIRALCKQNRTNLGLATRLPTVVAHFVRPIADNRSKVLIM